MKLRLALALAFAFVLPCLPVSGATLRGLWEFSNPANIGEATVGSDLTVGGTHTHHTSLADDGSQSLSGVVTTEGGVGSYFTAAPNMPANGGGAFVNQFSFIVDVFTPAGSRDGWRAIFQTNAAPDGNDADYWMNPASNLGVGDLGYTPGTIDQAQWTRLAVTVDLTLAGGDVLAYLDGSLFYTHPGDPGVDGRFSVYPNTDLNVAHFFGDNTAGENPPMNVGAIALFEGVLTPGQIGAMGGAGGVIIPEPASALLLALASLLGFRRHR